MKWLLLLSLFALTTCDEELFVYDYIASCEEGPVYQGRLAVKGICMNYVITLEGEAPEGWVENDLIAEQWTHPNTEVVYTNAFRLGTVCDFPENIEEGDTFYFTATSNPFKEENCAMCEAYSPVPYQTLFLSICDTP